MNGPKPADRRVLTGAPVRWLVAATALLGCIALAAPAAAHIFLAAEDPTTGTTPNILTPGRSGALVAAVVALVSVVIGGLALARAAGRIGHGPARSGAIVALVAGLIGTIHSGLALARSRRTG